MTNLKVHGPAPLGPVSELEGDLATLRGDCARMVPHWAAPVKSTPPHVSPSSIHGVSVPPASARLLDAMSDYGD